MQRAPQKILDRLSEFDSATLSNAVVENMGGTQGGKELEGKGGYPENYTGPEVLCMLPELGRAVGYAVTAELTPVDPDPPAIPWSEFYEVIDRTPSPVIAVFKDVGSRPGRGAAFGDNMAAVLKALGVTGSLIEGSARDLDGIKNIGLPIWATGAVPGHGVFSLIRVNSSVTVAQLRVYPGDLLVCDNDGCIKIPAGHDPEDILRNANEIRTREREFQAVARKPGFTLAQWTEFQQSHRPNS